MKKIFLILPLFFLFYAANSQQTVKKYVLLEHFTNTKCPICASKNPAFYNLINQYPNDVHHIAIHPSIPYNTCVFYLANPSENNARTTLYGIQGTPQVALNGVLAPLGSSLLTLSTLQAQLNQTSPLYVKVSETGSGATRSVAVEARSVGNVPAGNYKLYVAIVEKQINYNAPNGEAVHHDVFRKMLPDINGVAYTPAAQGQSVSFNFDYTLNAAWNADQVYVVAFIQNTMTKEILNSGTKYDPIVSATQAPVITQLSAAPNPAQDFTTVKLDNADDVQRVDLIDLNGRQMQTSFTREQSQLHIGLDQVPSGVYFIKITTADKTYTAKLVKAPI
ncbi:MAG: Omp28-related outer membrane protein [Bacteroidota bacterium]